MYVYYRNVKGDDRDRPNEATKLNQQQTRAHKHTQKSAECNDLEKQK